MKRSIVIVDDHLLIAEALADFIGKFDGYHVLYEVPHGQALIEKFKSPANIPDIVLLDINMPVMDGFETAGWLSAHHPAVSILALSMQDKEEILIRMIRAGARGYLLKNIEPQELKNALDTMVSSGFYYPDWVTYKVVHQAVNATQNAAPSPLTERELLFLQYATTELTYKEIAEKMNCSPRTVEGYRDTLFYKLSMKSRVGLVVYAIRNGIAKI